MARLSTSGISTGGIKSLKPRAFSKEFARDFSKGKEGYTKTQRIEIAVRYILRIQHLLGRRFEADMGSRNERVVKGLERIVKELVR
ncbi:MAG: hypothetical protein AB1668_03470 [Nanoarchaeota archaeon]